MTYQEFQAIVWQQGQQLYRDMPWRADTRPYYVLVSELMLQQTQASRVIPKFNAFIRTFPDEAALASAPLSDVLIQWQGLGYNRRAKFLHESAKHIVHRLNGKFPSQPADLLALPGVGKNTAGAIQSYAFNRPVVFIETNVRTVYMHHFFSGIDDVSDAAIAEVVAKTIDAEHPREFYWAIMDYGSHLKASGIRNNKQSRHYKKQSPLTGSRRQMRGLIIRSLARSDLRDHELRVAVTADERYESALQGLIDEGLVTRIGSVIHLTK